jgi:hypothetical protein
MPITKATQNVINPSITTLDTDQSITGQKTFRRAYRTTSSSSVTITESGTRTFIVNDSNLSWKAGDDIIALLQYSGIDMAGTVQSYNPATNTIIIDVTSATVESGGPYNSWIIYPSSNISLISKGVVFQGNSVPAFQATDLNGNVNFNVNGDSGLISTSVGIARTTEDTSQLNPMQVHKTKIWGQNWTFATPNQQVILDLGALLEFDMGGYEAWVSVAFNSFDVSTIIPTYDIGQYRDVFVVRQIVNSSQFGFQINSVASNTLFPIFTTAGRAVSAGGWSASRYPVALRAVQPTTVASGSLTLEIKGHTTADTVSVSYTSEISVVLTKTTIP